MATVLLDRIEGASLQTSLIAGSTVHARNHTRVAIVKDIAVDASADPNVLVKALAAAGLPQLGDPHPSGDRSILLFHDIRPLANDQAKILMNYGPFGGNDPNQDGNVSPVYTLEDGTIGQNITTQFYPNSGYEPIRMGYSTLNIPPKSVNLTYYQPMRTVVLTASNLLGDSKWTKSLRSSVGLVNEKLWLDMPKGYWLFYGFESQISITTGVGRRYNVRATLVCRNNLDWSFVTFMERPDGTPIEFKTSDIQTISSPEYSSTQSHIPSGIPTGGLIRIFPYRTTDFGSIFNFTRFDEVNNPGNKFVSIH
jgi:hypothetical protein